MPRLITAFFLDSLRGVSVPLRAADPELRSNVLVPPPCEVHASGYPRVLAVLEPRRRTVPARSLPSKSNPRIPKAPEWESRQRAAPPANSHIVSMENNGDS